MPLGKGTFATISLLLGLAHAVVQFVVWSIRPTPSIAWRVISFPLFWVLAPEIATRYFWIALISNSLLWGSFVFVASMFIGSRLLTGRIGG